VAQRFWLLTDEHFPNSVISLLESEGWEVARVRDLLGEGAKDHAIFAFAAEHRYVWVTSDERAQKHPRQYLAEGRPFVGMLLWTQENRYRMRPGEFLRQLQALALEEEPFAYGVRHIQPEKPDQPRREEDE
jgi:predicted nuclease of predicted toxin-antitoxin system